MRILIDGRMILPEMSGVGRYLTGLCRALMDLDSDLSYELWVQDMLPAGHPIQQLSGKRLHIRRVPLRHMSVKSQLLFSQYLQDPKPDLLHCPHFDLPLFMRGKVVASIHDLKYLDHPEYFTHLSWLKRIAMHEMMAYTCRRAQAVICVSKAAAADLQAKLNVPAQKIRVIYHGVDGQFFRKRSFAEVQAFRQKHALQKPFILFIGDRRPHKNLTGLIQAFAYFRESGGESHQLVIAGKGYRDFTLPEQTVSRLGLDGSVRFLDYFPDYELPLLYQSADLLALLSYYEGFGLPILEAMACGTPVVVSQCTSLPEIVEHAGLIIPPDDPSSAAVAFSRLIPGGDAREACIELGLKRAAAFTWERCALQTESLYQKVLAA